MDGSAGISPSDWAAHLRSARASVRGQDFDAVHAFHRAPRIVADLASTRERQSMARVTAKNSASSFSFAALVAERVATHCPPWRPHGASTARSVPPAARPLGSVHIHSTSIVKGPDGAYYIGQLTGVPFTAGAASVYRLEPGGVPEVFLEGFKTIIDLDFGPDGSLYVLEHASAPVFFGGTGRVVRVAPDGTRTNSIDGLRRPTSSSSIARERCMSPTVASK